MNTLKKEMRKGSGITAQKMNDAIIEAQGYASKAADILGVSRTSFYTHLNKYSTAKQTLADTREKRHEWVESKLMKQIKDDNLTAIIFYLKTQGKHLGYVERQEFGGVGGGPININVTYGINGKSSPAAPETSGDQG